MFITKKKVIYYYFMKDNIFESTKMIIKNLTILFDLILVK
jgi:hypothetical protein